METKMVDFYHRQFLMDLCSDCVNGNEQNKLRTYKLFKQSIHTENYLLTVKNRKLRTNICRFRVSSHNLPIETGRHRRPEKNTFTLKNL